MEPTRPDLRVLVFAPIGRDAAASADILQQAGINVDICADLSQLGPELEAGVGAVFIAEEGLFGGNDDKLLGWIKNQPIWSDLPFVVLTSHVDETRVAVWRQQLAASLRNVSFLERPVQPITLMTTLRSALRARARQYEIRALLADREKAAAELEALVAERTRALQDTNAKLLSQIAERARVEESLRQAQKLEAIGRLTGGVAHDFNNLLMVISGGLQMLRRRSDPDLRERLMDGMQQAANRGAGLVKQLLAFSRRQNLKPEPINIVRQIGGMRELLERSLRGDVHVKFEFADDLWTVEVDPGEFELVVLNLAVNARDAMPGGGFITVRAENCVGLNFANLHGDYVRVSVSDTGSGMSPDILEHVFEPFYTTKDIGKGSGLGLAQVHGFASQSRGAVRINSLVGRGTIVSLYLPRSDKTPPDQQSDNLPAQSDSSFMGSVLLVEDDNEVAKLTTEMLRELGFEVVCVASATAALGALANARPIDLVFSDIMMPGGMNGIELALEIRKRRQGLPVVLTSGYADAARLAAQAEGIRILAKPYRLEELSAALGTSFVAHSARNRGA